MLIILFKGIVLYLLLTEIERYDTFIKTMKYTFKFDLNGVCYSRSNACSFIFLYEKYF